MSAAAKQRTAERVAMLRRLVDALRTRDLTRSEAQQLLRIRAPGQRGHITVSESGTRAYFADLRDGGIVAASCAGPSQPHIYRLTASDEAIERFFTEAGNTSRKDSRKASCDPVTTPFLPKLHYGPPAPDPYALPAAFFSRPAEVRA